MKMRRFLELQCDRVESVAARYEMPIKIIHGCVNGNVLKLYYEPSCISLTPLRGNLSRLLHAEIAIGLGWIEIKCIIHIERKAIVETLNYSVLEAENEEDTKKDGEAHQHNGTHDTFNHWADWLFVSAGSVKQGNH